jgi:hypothetical protein
MRHGVHALRRSTQTTARLWRLPRVRRGITFAFIALALGMTGLAGWRFAEAGWPFSHGNVWFIVGAGLLFLLAYPVKAWGWGRLFAAGERPKTSSLAAAGGAAAVTGASTTSSASLSCAASRTVRPACAPSSSLSSRSA